MLLGIMTGASVPRSSPRLLELEYLKFEGEYAAQLVIHPDSWWLLTQVNAWPGSSMMVLSGWRVVGCQAFTV